jgi:hypothetical protein
MKRELRESYRIIANIGNLGLCNFCKYASFSGNCCDAELECEHSLPVINNEDHPDNVWSGGDCWGFRTNLDLQTCGIQASICHDGNIPFLGRNNEWLAVLPNNRGSK